DTTYTIAAMTIAPSAMSTVFSRGERSDQNCSRPSMSAPARRQARRPVRLEAQAQSLLDCLRAQCVLQTGVVRRARLELDLERPLAKFEAGNAAQRRGGEKLRELCVEQGEIIGGREPRARAQPAELALRHQDRIRNRGVSRKRAAERRFHLG